ncbi:hypothetical protein MATR_10350 [Marivirga tractuosa]|uniref:Uncharacterized protein n=1 Tax=Marivirga tractuosa (strain ATCC 23168 / DSM 4126 / NBRC 15989 / NCIMB 1408 / VKM B-1430 / H-43) TaxID=643867 RepID=E4TM60_MARTH|nr:hypothetical protein [Marivirga tractuosa]ADR21336.1 hypothetical protein Ftrac_1346 [Marivirga tractuosa DSM 4126]BDD14210.1 hypothetical protein MATR_10350 [Marivirga tractuosa]
MPKLISLSSSDKNKANPKDHEISVGDATKMVAKFDTRVRKLIKREYKDPKNPQKGFEDTKSVWFSKDVLDELFRQAEGCDGVRIYLGNHLEKLQDGTSIGPKDKSTTILVGTKSGSWTRPDGTVVDDVPIDQISDNNKIAIGMSSDDVIYDYGSLCPFECDGNKL